MNVNNLRRELVQLSVERARRVRMLLGMGAATAGDGRNPSRVVRVRNEHLHGVVCGYAEAHGVTYQAAFVAVMDAIFEGGSHAR